MRLLLAARADVRLPRPPRVNALHYAAFKLHWHDIALLTAAPHSGEALGAAGNSTLWASLSAQTPAGLEHLNAAQALEFAQTLETQQEGAMRAALGGDDGGDRTQQHCLARAAGLPPAIASRRAVLVELRLLGHRATQPALEHAGESVHERAGLAKIKLFGRHHQLVVVLDPLEGMIGSDGEHLLEGVPQVDDVRAGRLRGTMLRDLGLDSIILEVMLRDLGLESVILRLKP